MTTDKPNNSLIDAKRTLHEEWRPIDGWPYEVSNTGKIRNSKGKVLRPGIRSGYQYVVLCRNGGERHKSAAVHRFVAASFCDKPDWATEVNHKDGCKTNNSFTNLEWTNRSKNQRHAALAGLRPVGEKSPQAKLSQTDVEAIRSLGGTFTQQKIGSLFGIGQVHTGRILRGERWIHG